MFDFGQVTRDSRGKTRSPEGRWLVDSHILARGARRSAGGSHPLPIAVRAPHRSRCASSPCAPEATRRHAVMPTDNKIILPTLGALQVALSVALLSISASYWPPVSTLRDRATGRLGSATMPQPTHLPLATFLTCSTSDTNVQRGRRR